MLRAASLSPDKLAMARLAFDEAWAMVARKYVGREVIERARTQLATFVLTAMAQEATSAHEVRDAAIGMLRRAEKPVPMRKRLSP
jgi:hypothetical protein